MRVYTDAVPLVGRGPDLAAVAEGLRQSGEVRRRVVLVHGEPGIGKTRLVSDVCRREREAGVPVLWAQCVRFGASSAPLLPVVSAFRTLRAEVAAAPDPVTALLEAVDGDASAATTTRLVGLLESALAAIAADRSSILVADDVQWADASTLDILAYLVASSLPVPLSVVLTYRDTELGEGHPLLGWLGDVVRLPGVTDLRLSRLGREDTEAQVSALLGRLPPMTLVDEVQRHSGGNPYLTELLVRDLSTDAATLPGNLPEGLRTALSAAWHRLDAESREATRLLAVAGRPVGMDEFAEVAALAGYGAAGLTDALGRATGAGILSTIGTKTVWFHHPLLAEVLYESLTEAERRKLHATFVAAWADAADRDPALAGPLALHCERAGLPERAFGYALAASRHAAVVRAYPEEAEQLLRAAALWQRVRPAIRDGLSEARLLCDAAEAASRAGSDIAALEAATAARHLVDPQADPAGAARALRLVGRLAPMAGLAVSTQPPGEDDHEAVRLSELSDDIEEQAMCLAELSESQTWLGDSAMARALADRALTRAEQSGSDRARAWALVARSMTRWASQPGLVDADEAQQLALSSGDPDTIQHACIARANALETLHDFAGKADEYVRGYERAVAEGFVRQRQLFAAYAAQALMDCARYDDARRMLREALSFPSTGGGGRAARLNAVTLELYMGNVEAATHHLSRARELWPDPEDREPHLMVLYHLVSGRPAQAVEVAAAAPLQTFAGDPTQADWLVLLAAMAAGDLANQRTSDDADLVRAREALNRMVGECEADGRHMFEPVDEIGRTHGIVLRAELARAYGDADEPACWAPLGDIPDVYGEAWTVTLALLHWAQTLARQRAPRRHLAAVLRRAHERARDLGFDLIRRDVEVLARRAGITLDDTRLVRHRTHVADETVVLTPREREVLDLLAAGRTYAEIATALFISQKTVSVHVTHVLQKTGTSSRAEAAAWAWNQGTTEGRDSPR
jgi:DNA-binding CsgD family transcriptional regulator/tetratricopeptide (TPR) repeat protein